MADTNKTTYGAAAIAFSVFLRVFMSIASFARTAIYFSGGSDRQTFSRRLRVAPRKPTRRRTQPAKFARNIDRWIAQPGVVIRKRCGSFVSAGRLEAFLFRV